MTVGELKKELSSISDSTELIFMLDEKQVVDIDQINNVPPVPAACEHDHRKPAVEVYLYSR